MNRHLAVAAIASTRDLLAGVRAIRSGKDGLGRPYCSRCADLSRSDHDQHLTVASVQLLIRSANETTFVSCCRFHVQNRNLNRAAKSWVRLVK